MKIKPSYLSSANKLPRNQSHTWLHEGSLFTRIHEINRMISDFTTWHKVLWLVLCPKLTVSTPVTSQVGGCYVVIMGKGNKEDTTC